MSFCMTRECDQKQAMNQQEAKVHRENFKGHDVVVIVDKKVEKQMDQFEQEGGYGN